ncbi:YajG family lipoprotein [Ferrimonas gelatinilytica]|uniref:Lipoprotein n=1 Tax=Ferrimonas gelatinilytica TaxID=1255257 RepID=A0ABP9S2R9_9GAMM
MTRIPALIALFLTTLLAGCASQPEALVLAPLSPQPQLQAPPQSIALTSEDQRTAHYLARIQRGGNPAELVPATTDPRQLLEQGLADGLGRMGYRTGAAGTVTLSLKLEQLGIDVDQSLFKHSADSNLVARIVAQKGDKTLVKRYQTKGNFKGPFKAEPARIEQEMNDRMAQLLDAILNDAELHQFIQ